MFMKSSKHLNIKKSLRAEEDYATNKIYPWQYKKLKRVSFNLDMNSTALYTDWEFAGEGSSDMDGRHEPFLESEGRERKKRRYGHTTKGRAAPKETSCPLWFTGSRQL